MHGSNAQTNGPIEGRGRMANILSSFYQAADLDDPIDVKGFDAAGYTGGIIDRHDAAGLLRQCNEVGMEARTLNADLRMLVYENYSKLIGATDVIRQMKTDSSTMESEMEKVSEGITKLDDHHDEECEAERPIIVKGCLRKSELAENMIRLENMPAVLSRCVDKKRYEEAVYGFLRVLPTMKAIPYLSGPLKECETIILTLRHTVCEALPTLPAASLARHCQLLLDAGENPAVVARQMRSVSGAAITATLDTITNSTCLQDAVKVVAGELVPMVAGALSKLTEIHKDEDSDAHATAWIMDGMDRVVKIKEYELIPALQALEGLALAVKVAQGLTEVSKETILKRVDNTVSSVFLSSIGTLFAPAQQVLLDTFQALETSEDLVNSVADGVMHIVEAGCVALTEAQVLLSEAKTDWIVESLKRRGASVGGLLMTEVATWLYGIPSVLKIISGHVVHGDTPIGQWAAAANLNIDGYLALIRLVRQLEGKLPKLLSVATEVANEKMPNDPLGELVEELAQAQAVLLSTLGIREGRKAAELAIGALHADIPNTALTVIEQLDSAAGRLLGEARRVPRKVWGNNFQSDMARLVAKKALVYQNVSNRQALMQQALRVMLKSIIEHVRDCRDVVLRISELQKVVSPMIDTLEDKEVFVGLLAEIEYIATSRKCVNQQSTRPPVPSKPPMPSVNGNRHLRSADKKPPPAPPAPPRRSLDINGK